MPSATPSKANSSLPSSPSASTLSLVREQERHHADADQVGAVNALERARDHGAHAEQGGPLGRPVAAAAGAEIAPAEHDERNIPRSR